jgi:hypothetical protein
MFVAVCSAAILTFASLAPPLLAPGFPVGHDTSAHLTYMYLFDAALDQGQLPVRWIEGVRPGHSQPLFSFYQPGFYYAVELVHSAIASLLLSTKLTILGAWWLGGAFLWLYLRPVGIWPATLGALLFVRAPYLILDVFVRAALPEFVALSLAPVILWSLDRSLRSTDARYPMALALASAAMLLCHLPTVLMFVPVFLTYTGFVRLSGDTRGRWVARTGAACALGVGLASFYVFPAILELHLTKIRALTSEYFDYRQHFVEPWQWFARTWGYGGSEPGTADGMSFQAGVVQWIAAGLGLAVAARMVLAGRRGHAGPLAYWLVVLTAGLFMTTSASSIIWNAVPPLAFIQFPWRFLTVVSLAIAIIGAHALWSIKRHELQAIVVLCAAGGLWWQTEGLLKPSHYLARTSMYIDSPSWRLTPDASRMAFIEPGYFPATVPETPRHHVERWWIAEGAGTVSPRSVRDHRLVLDVESRSGVALTIGAHAFPGWRVLIDGRDTSWTHDASGFIVVNVPPGAHGVEAVFGDTAIRAWANRVTLLSGALWIGTVLGLVVFAARRRAGKRPD